MDGCVRPEAFMGLAHHGPSVAACWWIGYGDDATARATARKSVFTYRLPLAFFFKVIFLR
jgi:hypothetical protein